MNSILNPSQSLIVMSEEMLTLFAKEIIAEFEASALKKKEENEEYLSP